MKKKHKNAIRDLKKKKLEALITAIAAFITAALALACAGICVYHAFLPTPTYDTLTPKDYTFLRYEKTNGSSKFVSEEYNIHLYVKEESEPLLIQNIYTKKVDKELKNLQENVPLHCYIQGTDYPDCAYEIVEIEGDSPIMTLTEYNEIANKNTMWSIIIFSILTLIVAILGAVESIRYNKMKNKLQSMEGHQNET